MQCPKCQFQQDAGPECLRCGIIFDKVRIDPEMSPPEIPDQVPEHSGGAVMGNIRAFYKIFRWVSLTAAVIIIGLIFHDSPSPEVGATPFAAQQAETKVREFQSTLRRGQESILEMDQYELNGWLGSNLAINNTENRDAPPLQDLEAGSDTVEVLADLSESEAAELEKARSSVRDVRVELLEDTLRLYTVFDMHGVDLTLQIEAGIGVKDGYISLDPIGGKLGSLPIPPGTLKSALERLFESPENREKLRLPPHIRDMRVDSGRLIVDSREITHRPGQ